jgi:tRNA A-37 threonylcarbamoyl transferase component Bud32
MTSDETASVATTLGGRYRLGDVVGRGAMGAVHVAHDMVLDRRVAAKVLHPHLADDPATRLRFEREAQLAAQLQHPHAVAVFDCGEQDDAPYLIMEFVDGETLADRLARGPLDVAMVRLIGVQLLEALAAAHRIGIVHRDVKPANILLSAHGGAKLADFGIATILESASRTTAGLVVGTLAYLSPERLRGERATRQSDLYALGAVLYEALTNQKVHAAVAPVALLEAALGGAADVRILRPEVDPMLAGVIARSLQADPAERFADAESMRSALDVTVLAPPDTSGPSSATSARGVTPAPTLVMPALVGPALVEAGHKPRRRAVVWGLAATAVLAAGGLAAGVAASRNDRPSKLQQTVDLTPVTTLAPTQSPSATSTASAAPSTTAQPTISSTSTSAPDPTTSRGKGKNKPR